MEQYFKQRAIHTYILEYIRLRVQRIRKLSQRFPSRDILNMLNFWSLLSRCMVPFNETTSLFVFLGILTNYQDSALFFSLKKQKGLLCQCKRQCINVCYDVMYVFQKLSREFSGRYHKLMILNYYNNNNNTIRNQWIVKKDR